MARVQYGSYITALAGSIGGTSYQANKSGYIARAKPNFSNKNSILQQENKFTFNSVRTLWLALTQAQKDAWNVYASTHTYVTVWGTNRTLSGYNWFMACNINLINCSRPTISAVPATSVPAQPPVLDYYTVNQNVLDLGWVYSGSGYAHANIILQWFASYVTLNTSLKQRKDLRLFHYTAAGTSYVDDCEADYLSSFNISSLPNCLNNKSYLLICICGVQQNNGLCSVYRSQLFTWAHV
jgi:hypothetical protein